MASKTRSSDGCWTCRLRRKKCDEARPICVGCLALEIDCLYSDTKPDWMDNGEKQKKRADEIKAEVKRKAGWRREQKYMHSIENGVDDIEMSIGSEGNQVYSRSSLVSRGGLNEQINALALDESPPSYSGSQFDTSDTSVSGVTPASSSEGPTNSTTAATREAPVNLWGQVDASLEEPQLTQERELNLIQTYLDHVFPFLFPFYRPSLTAGGRGWLLMLLTKNKALYHSAISLSAFLFSILLSRDAGGGDGDGGGGGGGGGDGDGGDTHNQCQQHGWQELLKQQELSLRELQSSIQDIEKVGVAQKLAESARVMESIIQLLCFEVAIGNTDGWALHLDAAVHLFTQIIEHHGLDAGTGAPSWFVLLSRLCPPGFPFAKLRNGPLSSDQGALRFFAANLLHIDIISSTTLEAPPRLRQYHRHLLDVNFTTADGYPLPRHAARAAPDEAAAYYPPLNLDEYMGVENWILVALSDTSSLAAWKKDQLAAKTLSVADLVALAAPIEAALRSQLACGILCPGGEGEEEQDAASPPLLTVPDLVPAAYGNALAPQHARAFNRAWGHAALAYLLVVVNGWQPASEPVRACVDALAAQLRDLPTPSCLRVVAWPLCVAGCLARRDQEAAFRGLVGGAGGGLELLGGVREAMAIMEAVWARRDEIEAMGPGEWDFGRCFNVLGRRAFLV